MRASSGGVAARHAEGLKRDCGGGVGGGGVGRGGGAISARARLLVVGELAAVGVVDAPMVDVDLARFNGHNVALLFVQLLEVE